MIKDDGSIELIAESPETRLLVTLALLTQERFLGQIGTFMRLEQASRVRKLRMADGLTWRGVPESWEKHFAGVAT